MKYLTAFYLLITGIHAFAQSEWINDGSLMVIDSKGVVMRKGASINADKIKAIAFGESVIQFYDSKKPVVSDTVNNMADIWIPVLHKGDSGYVFSPYVSDEIQKYNPGLKDNWPQFFYPNPICGTMLYFNSNLNWYGVYETSRKDKCEIRSMNLTFHVSDQEEGLDGYGNNFLKILTGDENEPSFFFGIMDSIPNREFRVSPLPVKFMQGNINSENHFFPGDQYILGHRESTKESYHLQCYGSVPENGFDRFFGDSRNTFDDYRIDIVSYKWTGNGNGASRTKKLVQKLDLYQNDEFMFIGDLNYDNLSDFIIRRRLGHAESQTFLLLSNYGDKLYTLVASNYWGSCH